MRKAGLLASIVLLAFCACAKRRAFYLSGSQSRPVGDATLDSQTVTDPDTGAKRTLIHVLWIPAIPLTGMHDVMLGSGGTPEQFAMSYESTTGRIRSREKVTVVDGRRVDVGGRSYLLDAGNIFVVVVSPKGSAVRQVRRVEPGMLRDEEVKQLTAEQGRAVK